MMKSIAALVVATVMAAGWSGGTNPAYAASNDVAGAVKVTVNYTGAGKVDGSHRVWIWLFDTPNIGPGSMPIAEMSVEKNGDVATFEADGNQVWIAVAYDVNGVMAGNAPPPSGSPIGIYATSTGAPEAVTPGAMGAVTLTFDDSQRMP
jgi:hypothetical protein